MPRTIRVTKEDGVAVVRLDRPERLNAISREMLREIGETVADFQRDPEVRAVVFTGEGRAFSAGADIHKLLELGGPADFLDFIEEIQIAFNALENLNRPTIAALNGIAFGGGCELALSCDLRVLADDASMGVPEVKIGVLPGAGGTQRLSRLLPPAVAKEMIYLGEPMSAADCLRHGLVNAVVPREDVLAWALGTAQKLASLPALALRSAKLLVHGASFRGLEEGIESERLALGFLFGTEDRDEGMRAFTEKRPARFRGR